MLETSQSHSVQIFMLGMRSKHRASSAALFMDIFALPHT